MGYNDFIWTNHATSRLKDRKTSKDLVLQAAINPDRIVTKSDGTKEYQKRFDNQIVAAIVKENEKGEKIILSCWIDPPNSRTRDFRKRERYIQMQKGGTFKKLWLTFLDQIGL